MPSGPVAKISARKERWLVLCVVTSGLVLGLGSSSTSCVCLHLPSAVGSPRSQQNCACTAQSKERAPWPVVPYPLKQAELFWSAWAVTSGYLSGQLHMTKLFAYTACGAAIQNLFSALSIVILHFTWGNTKSKIVQRCKSETAGKKKPPSSQGLWQ